MWGSNGFVMLGAKENREATMKRRSILQSGLAGAVAAALPRFAIAQAANARVLRRMFMGLPVNLDRLSAVARGYVMHPPRDDNCPPPEIGYGGRWRRPPKDYAPPRDWE